MLFFEHGSEPNLPLQRGSHLVLSERLGGPRYQKAQVLPEILKERSIQLLVLTASNSYVSSRIGERTKIRKIIIVWSGQVFSWSSMRRVVRRADPSCCLYQCGSQRKQCRTLHSRVLCQSATR
jgi:hypothetical protein